MGGPYCYPKSNKGQTHRPATRPLWQGMHTLVDRQSRDRECELLPVEYQLPVRGKRVNCGFFPCWTSLQPPAAVGFSHTVPFACVGSMNH